MNGVVGVAELDSAVGNVASVVEVVAGASNRKLKEDMSTYHCYRENIPLTVNSLRGANHLWIVHSMPIAKLDWTTMM